MAQWDSVLGFQWLAYVAPDAAWSAFRGLMSLVSAEGAISGESLPARKAQTAWILYSLTKDRSQLEEAYPEIRRNLLWEEKNPRWIYEDHNNPDQRDLEFTAAWIYDADFAMKISNEIGNKADVEMWKKMQTETVANSRAWFFSDPKRNSPILLCKCSIDAENVSDPSPSFFRVYYPSSRREGISGGDQRPADGLFCRGLSPCTARTWLWKLEIP